MRVAVVVGEYPSITETFVATQITGLRERGHEVDVFGSLPRSRVRGAPDASVHYEPVLGTGLWRYVSGARLLGSAARPGRRALVRTLNPLRFGRDAVSLRLLRAAAPWVPHRSYDVVHCHFGENGLRAVMLRELGVLRGAIVTTFHGADMSEYLRRRGTRSYGPLLKAGELFLPVSDRWRERLIAMGGDPTRIRVHHMGVDCNRIAVGNHAPRTPHQVLSVARLVEKKGIEFGIEAFALLARDRRDVRYQIIGGGELRTRLERLARTRGVADLVDFVGPQPHDRVLEALQQADIFLAPAVTASSGDEEGIPVALMEAMAAGVAVVASRHSGIPELVAHGTTGLLTEERDVRGLVAALKELLDRPERRRTMGLAARAEILADYDARSQNDRLVGLFRRVIDERSRAA